MDYQSFGAVARLLAVTSMVVTVINNYWRFGNIDLTGRYANMRTIYARASLIGVVIAAVARLNIVAMLRTAPAFDSYLNFYGIDIVDDAVGILVTGVVIGFLGKFWNDAFDLLFELKRLVRGKANATRADEQPRAMREPREREPREMRDMRRGRRGSRGGRGMGGPGPGGDRDRGDRPDRGDRGDRPASDRGDRGPNDRDREVRRPDFPREPSGGTP